MFRRMLAAAVTAGALALAAAALAQPTADASYPPNDYSDQANWLCWPGRDDACAADLTATVVDADGSTQVQKFQADPGAPIDCFYVYPTVSRDPGIFSTMKVAPEERNVVIQQAARLRASCRLYAPMYRQFTLTALQWFTLHPPPPGSPPPPLPGEECHATAFSDSASASTASSVVAQEHMKRTEPSVNR